MTEALKETLLPERKGIRRSETADRRSSKNATDHEVTFLESVRQAGQNANTSAKTSSTQNGLSMSDEINKEIIDAKIEASEARTETKIETLRGEINSGFARVETSFAKQRVWVMGTAIGTVTFLSVVIGLFGD